MPYHVKAAVNHMHYCSSAYINHYEIFLGEKCSRACREPLCPLFKWNKLVILRAWQIICNNHLVIFSCLWMEIVFSKATMHPRSWSLVAAIEQREHQESLQNQPRCHCTSAMLILVASWLWDTRSRFCMALHSDVSTHQLIWGWHGNPWHCCFTQEYGPAVG